MLRRCVRPHEHNVILQEAHQGICGGHMVGDVTTKKVFQAGLWWPTIQKDAWNFVRACDTCQRIGQPPAPHRMPLNPILPLEPFQKWGLDFLFLFPPLCFYSTLYYSSAILFSFSFLLCFPSSFSLLSICLLACLLDTIYVANDGYGDSPFIAIFICLGS